MATLEYCWSRIFPDSERGMPFPLKDTRETVWVDLVAEQTSLLNILDVYFSRQRGAEEPPGDSALVTRMEISGVLAVACAYPINVFGVSNIFYTDDNSRATLVRDLFECSAESYASSSFAFLNRVRGMINIFEHKINDFGPQSTSRTAADIALVQFYLMIKGVLRAFDGSFEVANFACSSNVLCEHNVEKLTQSPIYAIKDASGFVGHTLPRQVVQDSWVTIRRELGYTRGKFVFCQDEKGDDTPSELSSGHVFVFSKGLAMVRGSRDVLELVEIVYKLGECIEYMQTVD